MIEQFVANFNVYEIIGLVATLLVLISFSLNGERKIRMVNVIGASFFVVYGILINSLSTWVLNSFLIIIHATKLYKTYKKEREKNSL
ncbi:MAG: YgjV family protein [Bacilli bacterium]|nr:YgjV family protein [Bacilli bacterium]